MPKTVRQQATAADMNRLQAGALGLHADATDLKPGLQQEDNGPRRPKKEKTAAQTVAAKISVLSAKNAEIMSWSARVSDSDKLSLDLKCISLESLESWHLHSRPWYMFTTRLSPGHLR